MLPLPHFVDLLVVVLLSDPRAKVVDVSGGAVVQLQAGDAPQAPLEESEPSVLFALVPEGELLYRDRIHASMFSLRYRPRVLLRWPNLANIRRPLVLHQIDADYTARMAEHWDYVGQATVNVGELDYTAARFVFSEVQGALPEAEVTQYLMSAARMSFIGTLRPRHTFALSPEVSYSQPIDEEDNAMATLALPRSFTTTLFLSHGWLATRRDTLTTTVGGGYVDFEERGAQTTGEAQLAWARRITPRLDSDLAAGVFAAEPVRAAEMAVSSPAGRSPILPTGAAGLNGRVYNRAHLRLTVDLGAATQAFYDMIQGEVIPRAGGNVGLTAFVPPRWTAAVRGSMYTTATREPRDFGSMDLEVLAQSETVITAQTPISYEIDEHYSLELGTLFTARGPHFRAPDWALTQIEIWFYTAFRFSFSTAQIERQRGGGGSTVTGGVVQ